MYEDICSYSSHKRVSLKLRLEEKGLRTFDVSVDNSRLMDGIQTLS